MFYEFTGKVIINESSVLLKNNEYKKTYQLQSNEQDKILKVISYLTGLIDINQVSSLTEVKLKDIKKIINSLDSLGLIDRKQDNNREVIIIGCNHTMKQHFLNNVHIKDLISFHTNIEETHKCDLIIHYEDTDKERNNNIESFSKKLGVPWLKVSRSKNKFLIGPLFLPDGGPCYSCYTQNYQRVVDNDYLIPSISTDGIITELIIQEIINLFKSNSPSGYVGCEVMIDLKSLVIKKEYIYVNPECECSNG